MAERLSATKRTAAWLLPLVLALTVAACGDDGGSDDEAETEAEDAAGTDEAAEDSGTTETTVLTIDDVVAEYQSCMAGEGADLGAADAPTIQALLGSGDVPPEVLPEMGLSATYVDAHAACGADLETMVDAGADLPESVSPTTPPDPELAQQMHAAVECLNDRGWDFLEPGVETGPLVMEARDPDFNWDDPDFLQDQFECQQDAGMIPQGTFTPAPPPGG